MQPQITCRRVDVEAILPLRHRILRAGLPPETARFQGDDEAGTRHHAALVGNEAVGCLSLMRSQWAGRPAWQLRGMATDSAVQGRGIGRRLLETAVADARRDEPGWIFWCNARTSAVGFYEKLGWRVVSEPFDLPTAGPHVRMVRDAGSAAECHASAAARRPVVAFVSVEAAFLAAAHLLGGPPWVALAAAGFGGQVAADFRVQPLLGLLPAAGWLVAHELTGNRELFFPYAMALAAHLAGQFLSHGQRASALAGGLLMAAFLAIRCLQSATAPVLAVECGVAAAILAATVALLPAAAVLPRGRPVVTVLASLAAYAGLAL